MPVLSETSIAAFSRDGGLTWGTLVLGQIVVSPEAIEAAADATALERERAVLFGSALTCVIFQPPVSGEVLEAFAAKLSAAGSLPGVERVYLEHDPRPDQNAGPQAFIALSGLPEQG